MIDTAHLNPDVVPVLQLPLADRVDYCKTDRWIGYTRATEIMDKLDQLMVYPKSLRMPSVLIVGRSGNGKSSIVDRFTNKYPIQISGTGEAIVPVLRISMPETPNESEFWSDILWALGISHGDRDPAHVKKKQAKSFLAHACLRVLVIDEFNNITTAGKGAGDLLAAIKGISNDLKVSIVAAGTQAAINAMNLEPQMKSRFDPAVLDRWQLNKEYLRFLASYERLLPLAEPSNLASREIASALYAMAGETIGSTVSLIKEASSFALTNGKERIDEAVLKEVPWTKENEWENIARRV